MAIQNCGKILYRDTNQPSTRFWGMRSGTLRTHPQYDMANANTKVDIETTHNTKLLWEELSNLYCQLPGNTKFWSNTGFSHTPPLTLYC